MQTLTLTLAANQTVAFDIAGRYFEVIDSVSLVSVSFYDANGSRTKDLELQRVLSGFFVKGAFSRFEITEVSGIAQTITVLYGSTEGGTRRSPGIVRVVDEITDAINCLSFSPPLAITTLAWTAIVPPASNVRGVILRQAAIGVQNGSGGYVNVQLAAVKITPTGYTTPSQRYPILGQSAGGSNATLISPQREMNKYLPPGWGIWAGIEVTGAAAVSAYAQVVYELTP